MNIRSTISLSWGWRTDLAMLAVHHQVRRNRNFCSVFSDNAKYTATINAVIRSGGRFYVIN